MKRRLATLPRFPHLHVGRFDVAPKSVGIEKRVRHACPQRSGRSGAVTKFFMAERPPLQQLSDNHGERRSHPPENASFGGDDRLMLHAVGRKRQSFSVSFA
jgi:hypothetical protein